MSAAAAATASPATAEREDWRWNRICCGLGAAFWAVVFIWLLIGASPAGRSLGLLWFALGMGSPRFYVFSLALALPWFGDNPGGPHLLYLWDMGMMGFVIGHLERRARGLVAPRRNRLDPWITLFVAVSWLGIIVEWAWLRGELLFEKIRFMEQVYSHYANAETFGLRMVLDLTLSAGFYTALRDRPWTLTRQIVLWRVLLAALALTSFAGLLHYLHWLPLGWWRGDVAYSMRFGMRRLQSLYWDPGWFAEYLGVLAPAAVAFAWVRTGKARRRWAALAAALAVIQLLTLQRAGWLALGAGYAAVSFAAAGLGRTGASRARLRSLLRAALVIGGVMILAALLALFIPDFRHRAASLAAYRDRTEIWARAWKLIWPYHLTGVGTGDYAHYYTTIFFNDAYGHELMTAHNQYLHIWAERGIAGLVFFLAIVAGMGGGLLRALGAPSESGASDDAAANARIVRLALLGGLAAFLVDGIFQYNFYVRAIETVFWLFAGWSTWVAGAGALPVALPPAPAGAPALGAGAFAPLPPYRAPRRWPRWIIPLLLAINTAWFWHENDERLHPWTIGFPDGRSFDIGAEQVLLPIPPQAHRLSLSVATIQPGLDKQPLVYTVSLDGKTLATASLSAPGVKTLEIDLPPDTKPGGSLTVSVSQTWSPWAYGMHYQFPILKLGVMYQNPVVIN